MGRTYTPKLSALRSQLYARILRLSDLIDVQAVNGSPEGVEEGNRGDIVIDSANGTLWIKTVDGGVTGWTPIGGGDQAEVAYGSVGWATAFGDAGVVQTGSGAGLVDVVGPGTLTTATDFDSPSPNTLRYTGDAAAWFFVQADINAQNPNGEETPAGFELTLNGVVVPASQRADIVPAGSIVAVSTHVQLNLEPGDVIGAQIGSLANPSADMTATYFRLQAERQAPSSEPPVETVTFTFPGSDLLPLDLFHSRRALLGGQLARCWVAWTDTQTSGLRVLDFGHGGSSADPTVFVPALAGATRTFVDLGNAARSPDDVALLVELALLADGVNASSVGASVTIQNASNGVVPPDVDATDTTLRGMTGGQRDNWGSGSAGQTLNQDGGTGGIGSVHIPPLGSEGRILGAYLWTISGSPMDVRLAFGSGPAYGVNPGAMAIGGQGRMTAQGFGAISFEAVGVGAAEELWAQYRGNNGGGPRFRAPGATPPGLGDLVPGELLLWDTTSDPDAAVPFGPSYTPVVDATFNIYVMIGLIFELPDANGNYLANGTIELRVGDQNNDPDHGTQTDADAVQLSGENTHQRFQWVNWTAISAISVSRTVAAIAADEDSRPSMYQWSDLNIPSTTPADLIADMGPMGLTPGGAGAAHSYTLPTPVPMGVEALGQDAIISLGFNYVTDDGSPLAGFVLPVFIETLGDGAWLSAWEDDRATWHDNIPGASDRAFVSGVQEYRQRNVAGSPFQSIAQTWPDPMITDATDDSPPAIALDWTIFRREGISLG